MIWPSEKGTGSVPVFTRPNAGVWVAGTVTLSEGEVVGPELAVAVLVKPPASISGCVAVCWPVQVMDSPGSSPPMGRPGQEAGLSSCGSVIVTGAVSVMLPVFVTTKSKMSTSDVLSKLVGEDAFRRLSSSSAGAGAINVLLLPCAGPREPPAGIPVTVTVLSTWPALTSAWVTGTDSQV